MDAIRTQAVAQELLDLTRQLKEIEDQILQLKLEISVEAGRTFDCKGGRVVCQAPSLEIEIDETVLRRKLNTECGLSEAQVSDLIMQCRPKKANPSVEVILE